MIKAVKEIHSRGSLKEVGFMFSRAGVSLCERFLFYGEYRNPESETRNAVISVIEGEAGRVVGTPLLIWFT